MSGNLPVPPIPPAVPPPPQGAQTPLNDPSGQQTDIRATIFRVLGHEQGHVLPGAEAMTVETNSYYRADHFTLTFAISAGPPGWWDQEPPWVLDVQVSLDEGRSWTSLIIGEVDHMTVSLQTGTLVMEGRDLSARLIETKTQEAFINQTSSEVAAAIVARHAVDGFTAPVITPTTTLVGRYYIEDHVDGTLDQFSRATTEWDLLTFLAQREGFDVFMQGTTLHFQPITLPTANPYIVQWDADNGSSVPRMNVTTLRMERSLTLAKDIEVWVRSWATQQGRGFTKKAKATGAKSKGGAPQRYVFVRPNLTEKDAQDLANQLAIDLTKHERVIEFDQPGSLTLTPRNIVRLQGTNTSFDQTYFIDHINRSLSFHEGFRQSVRCKNSSPRSQVQVT